MSRPSVNFQLMMSLNMGKKHTLTYSGAIKAPGHILHHKVVIKHITTKMGFPIEQTVRYWLEGDSEQEFDTLSTFAKHYELI
jgi:hypothetical protein